MDTHDNRIANGVLGKAQHQQFKKNDRPKNRRNIGQVMRAKYRHVESIVVGKEKYPEMRYVLIDYRSENAQLKSKMMTALEAHEKNRLLEGSGFAWARCSK
jgi:hypothetical protein